MRAREMAQLRLLPHKHEEWSVKSQHPLKCQVGMKACYNPSTRGAKTENPYQPGW